MSKHTHSVPQSPSLQQSIQSYFRNERIYYGKSFQTLSKANSKTHFYKTGFIVYRNGQQLFFHSKARLFLMPESKRFLEAKPKNISGQPRYRNQICTVADAEQSFSYPSTKTKFCFFSHCIYLEVTVNLNAKQKVIKEDECLFMPGPGTFFPGFRTGYGQLFVDRRQKSQKAANMDCTLRRYLQWTPVNFYNSITSKNAHLLKNNLVCCPVSAFS